MCVSEIEWILLWVDGGLVELLASISEAFLPFFFCTTFVVVFVMRWPGIVFARTLNGHIIEINRLDKHVN